ncbi:MAG: hypothetical protein NTV44_00820 [Firmicutes bacterium]|nr:hypothetical protein [Bacillota bacterium]
MEPQNQVNDVNKTFFELFKQIEDHLGVSESEYFMDNFRQSAVKDKRLRKFERTIDVLRKLRNLEAHEANTSGYYEVAAASIDTLRLILSYIASPQRAYDVCVKEGSIYKVDIKANIHETIAVMAEKNFSYVPVYSGKELIGVFSGDVLLTIFSFNREADFNSNTTFEFLKPFLALDKHLNEAFEFVKRDVLLSDIERDFIASFEKPQNLVVAFITENGLPNETIIGMITQWDLIVNEEK